MNEVQLQQKHGCLSEKLELKAHENAFKNVLRIAQIGLLVPFDFS